MPLILTLERLAWPTKWIQDKQTTEESLVKEKKKEEEEEGRKKGKKREREREREPSRKVGGLLGEDPFSFGFFRQGFTT